ncbi:hypothetical protein IZ6_10650 [Terrihabitans soli]|uniref:Uncharacterized protein n=1 Tax=Terrihabitans soli TaxID=708113 RepID=A0A6S6QTR5_9HYPH|nr:hypothetical protein IZ6_10650 [Terrihabitans soli]
MPAPLTDVPTLRPPTDVLVETPERLTEAPTPAALPTEELTDAPERLTDAPALMPPTDAPADMPPRPTEAPAEMPPLLLFEELLLLAAPPELEEPDDVLLPLPRPPRPPPNPPRPSASAGSASANVMATAVAAVFLNIGSSLRWPRWQLRFDVMAAALPAE